MDYPGRTIKAGEGDAELVRALKLRLNEVLALQGDDRLDPDDPNFGPRMRRVVKLFQARHVDSEGRPLRQDGEVASLTWGALFGEASVPSAVATADTFLATVLDIAAREEARQVRERPRNSNRGPEVDEYLRRAGAPPGHAWCCAFVYWCFDEAARARGLPNPMVRTAGCLAHWQGAPRKGGQRVMARDAVGNPALVQPGMVFVMDHGRGLGHTGLVDRVTGGFISTIEGNTDASRTREGGGVYRLTRKLVEINKGYIFYDVRA